MTTNQPQLSGEGFNSIAGMSKSQLYELMSQMKLLIEQNQQQAKQILIDNPMLTRALFQAQILLGMVRPTQSASIQQVLSQPQSTQMGQQINVQNTQSLPSHPGHQGQTSSSQPLGPPKPQNPPQPSISLPSTSVPQLNVQLQTAQPNPQHAAPQARGFTNSQIASVSAPLSSQMHNLPVPTPPAAPHFSVLPAHMPTISNQAQPSLQMPGMFNQPMQPPLPQQPRPLTAQPFHHQLHSQMPHNLGFQPSVPQHLMSQPMFHPGGNPISSFPQGQPPLPSQPPPQHLYQGGPRMSSEYNSQAGSSIKTERGVQWTPSFPERPPAGPHFHGPPGPPPMVPGQMGPSSVGAQPRPSSSSMSPEMEQTLFRQVLSLTPEQINLLPPEQRQQVMQLQNMLRLERERDHFQ